jgi:hypothetical protein
LAGIKHTWIKVIRVKMGPWTPKRLRLSWDINMSPTGVYQTAHLFFSSPRRGARWMEESSMLKT